MASGSGWVKGKKGLLSNSGKTNAKARRNTYKNKNTSKDLLKLFDL